LAKGSNLVCCNNGHISAVCEVSWQKKQDAPEDESAASKRSTLLGAASSDGMVDSS